jgi:outer membrane protein
LSDVDLRALKRQFNRLSMILRLLRRSWRSSFAVLSTALAVPLAAAEGAGARAVNTTAATAGIAGPQAAGERWTLERALARAVEANPDLLAAKFDVERQEGARLQVQARLMPSVTASVGMNQREQALIDVSPSQRANPLPPSPDTAVALFGYDMRIEVRQVLFDGFANWNMAKRQRLLGKQAYLALCGTVAHTVSLVRQGFDAILLRTAAVTAEQRRVEEYEQVVKWTSRKQSEGDVPEFELLRAEAELEGARADLAEAVRSMGQAEQSFRRLLQISDTAGTLQLEGKFEPRPFSLPLDEAINQARANRPDLQAAVIALEAARRNQLADTGNYLPKVEAFASYGSRTSYYTSSIRLTGWTYGVTGQWDLFEGGAARGRRISLRADRRGAEARLAEIEQGIVSKLHELYQGLQQARVAMEAQEKSVGMSARASRDARRQYEVGSANLEQVLQAGMTFRRAESRRNEAVYSYNSTIAEIELALGGQMADSVKVPDTWKR